MANCKAPILRRTTRGKRTYCWRKCPYSTEDSTNRIPNNQKSTHYTTSGRMAPSIRDGHDRNGWVCLDDNCSFFTGIATSGIEISIKNVSVNQSTGEYTITEDFILNMPCSGARFFET